MSMKWEGVRVEQGDCREVVRTLADCSVDSCVTDPPYSLVSIQKRFRKPGSAPYVGDGATGVYKRASAGFMGKQWDTGETAFDPAFWSEVLRVLKPGAHLIAFGGTRTYHRLACAIEDAGFEIRDQIGWAFGAGFPKSHDVSKGIDKAAGAEREKVRVAPRPETSGTMGGSSDPRPWIEKSRKLGYHEVDGNEPATDAARQWQGWGTALKPAWEPCVVARKPLIGTVAENVLTHGTGAINIDGCRVGTDGGTAKGSKPQGNGNGIYGAGLHGACEITQLNAGRWPANLIHDGSEEVLAAFPDSESTPYRENVAKGDVLPLTKRTAVGFADNGSAARFFYNAKADAGDRLGSKHPTVKPVDLMAYLCRLVTPPGGTVLDPFAGSGTTGMACIRESFGCILIEREAEYVADIKRRLAHVSGADTPLFGGETTPPVAQDEKSTGSLPTKNHHESRRAAE